jgi:hypothetical protein
MTTNLKNSGKIEKTDKTPSVNIFKKTKSFFENRNSLYSMPINNQMSNYYTKRLLDFKVEGSEFRILSSNKAEIIIVIDNRSSFDWPSEIFIKGDKKCKLTENIYQSLDVKIKAFHVKDIKFTFETNYNLYGIRNETMKFSIVAIDNSKNIKYVSKMINVDIRNKNKKEGLFNLCSFVS